VSETTDPRIMHEAGKLITRMILKSRVEDAREPHCYLAIDPDTGHVQATGPYPNAEAARIAGEKYRDEQLRDSGEPAMTITVAPMYTPDGGIPEVS